MGFAFGPLPAVDALSLDFAERFFKIVSRYFAISSAAFELSLCLPNSELLFMKVVNPVPIALVNLATPSREFLMSFFPSRQRSITVSGKTLGLSSTIGAILAITVLPCVTTASLNFSTRRSTPGSFFTEDETARKKVLVSSLLPTSRLALNPAT